MISNRVDEERKEELKKTIETIFLFVFEESRDHTFNICMNGTVRYETARLLRAMEAANRRAIGTIRDFNCSEVRAGGDMFLMPRRQVMWATVAVQA
jgi:hypothetical protein